ncbi:MAG TPA: preprotein translocase subunit YajC [Acidobacteriota bacterium]|nr:preprotein translocase subunit YajC [Acidobacteriota bacterium]
MIMQLFLAQQNGVAQPNLFASFLPILAIIAIFYLLIYRPMRRRQKNLEQMIASLKNGDKVITNGGIYGTVAGIRENTVLLKVSDQVKLEVAKSAIASMQAPDASK